VPHQRRHNGDNSYRSIAVPVCEGAGRIGTVAYYGPDDKVTTKIATAVIRHEEAEPVLKRWVGTDVTTSPEVQKELQESFQEHGVRSVALSEGNMGCPPEEGEDFPAGEDCPFCPLWKGKQGSNRRDRGDARWPL
jgi:hypothetical protein